MPFIQFPISVGAPLYQARETQLLERLFISSASLLPENTGIGQAEAYGQILIVSCDAPEPVPVAILASGYLGASVIIGWTGRIKMDISFGIQARVWCNTPFTFRCSVLTEGS